MDKGTINFIFDILDRLGSKNFELSVSLKGTKIISVSFTGKNIDVNLRDVEKIKELKEVFTR
jgi:hypothetical protein